VASFAVLTRSREREGATVENRKSVGIEQRLLKPRVQGRMENTRPNDTCVRRTLEHRSVILCQQPMFF